MVERNTVAQQADLEKDPAAKARREAENGLKQAALAAEIIRAHVKDPERPFRLTQGILLKLHHAALEGIHPLAGTYRNGKASIHGSSHEPPDVWQVADEVALLCEHVRSEWNNKSAIYLASYVMWRLNWIHPFADGNGRTSRAGSYVVLSIKLDSLLPGTPTIPEQIDSNKKPYYDALESADASWKERQEIDVSELENLLNQTLAVQLVNAAKQAHSN